MTGNAFLIYILFKYISPLVSILLYVCWFLTSLLTRTSITVTVFKILLFWMCQLGSCISLQARVMLLSLLYTSLQNPGQLWCPGERRWHTEGWVSKRKKKRKLAFKDEMCHLRKRLNSQWLSLGFPEQTEGSCSIRHSGWDSYQPEQRHAFKMEE